MWTKFAHPNSRCFDRTLLPLGLRYHAPFGSDFSQPHGHGELGMGTFQSVSALGP
jgi:hypothetical protein